MPECRELKIIALILVFVLLIRLGVAFGADVMQLIAIWIDPTIKEILAEEARTVDKDSLSPAEQEQRRRVLNRQAYSLPARSTITRGSSAASGRSHVWPEGLSSLRSLRLLGVDYTARSIILDFGARILTVRLINHTSVQVYRRAQWESSVRDIPADKDARQFKIAIALEFADFVIAFLSADLVFEPHWYDCIESLHDREPPPDFVFTCPIPRTADEFELDLSRNPASPLPFSLKAEIVVARWCDQRRNRASRSDFAILVIRRFERVFPGKGVYSVCELFARAGLSVYLTEAELFDNPSRVARLLLAMYAFMFEAHYRVFAELVRPAIRDTVLAPTSDQRISCGKSAFRVFAKTSSRVTRRLKDLQTMYLTDVASTVPVRYDLYEPAFVAIAHDQDNCLSRLVFGSALLPRTGLRAPSCKGPLEEMFEKAGLLDAPTYLCDDRYEPALPARLSLTAALIKHYAFRIQTNGAKASMQAHQSSLPKQRFVRGVVWTYVPPHPHCVHFAKIHMLNNDDMTASTFDTVIKHTKQVVVGPLEWFGNAIPSTLYRRPVVGMCIADPVAFKLTAESNAIIRIIKGRERRRFLAANPGLAGAKMPAALVARQQQQVAAYRKAVATASALAQQPEPPALPTSIAAETRPRLVRRRLHADARLVLDASSTAPSTQIPSPLASPIVDSPMDLDIDFDGGAASLALLDDDSDGFGTLSEGGASLPPVSDAESDAGASVSALGNADFASDDEIDPDDPDDDAPLPPLGPVSLAIPNHPVYASSGRSVLVEQDADQDEHGSSEDDLDVAEIISDTGDEGSAADDEDDGSEYVASSSSSSSYDDA